MKLINEKIKERIEQFPLYSQDGKRKEAQVIAKFFLSQGAWTWYILEGNLSEDTLYGITVSGDGGCEYGYISIKELESLRSVLGLGVEVDKYFEPCKVGDLKDGYVERFIESLYGKDN